MDRVLSKHREVYLPAYADLSTYTTYKPVEILVSVQKSYTALARSRVKGISNNERSRRIGEADHHIVEASIKCYKVLWISMDADISAVCSNPIKRKVCVISSSEFNIDYTAFNTLQEEAIKEEETGNLDEAVIKQKEAIRAGKRIINNIYKNRASYFTYLGNIAFAAKILPHTHPYIFAVLTSMLATIFVMVLTPAGAYVRDDIVNYLNSTFR